MKLFSLSFVRGMAIPERAKLSLNKYMGQLRFSTILNNILGNPMATAFIVRIGSGQARRVMQSAVFSQSISYVQVGCQIDGERYLQQNDDA